MTEEKTAPWTRDDFRDWLKINKHDLDEELIRQPQLYALVSEHYVMAVSVRDQEKAARDTAIARTAMIIRKEMADAGVRATEAIVTATLDQHPDAIAANEAYLDKKTEADLWAVMKDAYNQRGYMIRDLCGLYVSNYYSANSVEGPDITETKNRAHIKRRKEIRQKKLSKS